MAAVVAVVVVGGGGRESRRSEQLVLRNDLENMLLISECIASLIVMTSSIKLVKLARVRPLKLKLAGLWGCARS